jgi:hypothetical protein
MSLQKSVLHDLTHAMLAGLVGAAAGTVARIIDHVDRALLPYRTGSHWYALRVRHVDYDRFLVAVGSRMTALQPCRVEDVACRAGQPSDFLKSKPFFVTSNCIFLTDALLWSTGTSV